MQWGKNKQKDASEELNYRDDIKYFLSYLRDLLLWVIGAMLVFTFLFRIVIVSGDSMKNTLYDGDCLLLLGNVFYSEPQYGDIIVVNRDTSDEGKSIIKRVIATEGQVVNIDGGIVYVDNVALEENYVTTPTYPREISFPLTVEEGCIFVLGDNREISLDSRSAEVGLIDTREIVGKAILLAFPGNDKGNIPRDFKRIGAVS